MKITESRRRAFQGDRYDSDRVRAHVRDLVPDLPREVQAEIEESIRSAHLAGTFVGQRIAKDEIIRRLGL